MNRPTRMTVCGRRRQAANSALTGLTPGAGAIGLIQQAGACASRVGTSLAVWSSLHGFQGSFPISDVKAVDFVNNVAIHGVPPFAGRRIIGSSGSTSFVRWITKKYEKNMRTM